MKERIARIFVFLLGIGWILGTIAYKKFGFSLNTNTDLTSLAFYGPGTISGISLGVAMILVAIFSRAISFYVAVWSIVGGITLLCADNLIYLASPWLPRNLVKIMTQEAMDKYLNFHHEEIILANDGRVWFFKPGAVRYGEDSRRLIYDELGYGNPPGYLAGLQGADVLIFGDSFVEQTELPEILRELLAPATTYALGIGGQGPPHWRWHFQRYIKSAFYRQPPKVVVLNFYSGDDFSDTKLYQLFPDVPENYKKRSVTPAWPTRRFSFFQELLSIVQKTVFTRAWLSQFPPVRLDFFEPDLDLENSGGPETLLTLSGMVEDIRRAAPSAKILLSVQAPVLAIYGLDRERCKAYIRQQFPNFGDHSKECEFASANHLNISKILGEWAQEHGVQYIDPTTELQRQSRITNLLLGGDMHLSPEGCRIYAEAIATKITELNLLGGE